MNAIAKVIQNNPRLKYLIDTLSEFRYWLIAPAIAGLLLAGAYAFLVRADTWTSRQSFIIRDDLSGDTFKPGRFESQESLKSAQETILEIARRPKVIRKALEKLGPPPGASAASWIDDERIEKTQGVINFSAPNGAEFGKTEVIVLTTRDSTRERSRQFIELLSEEIVNKVNEVRALRLESMEAELLEARDGAVREQQAAIEKLEQLDKLLGANVSVMNSLNEAQAGESTLKKDISQIKNARRPIELSLKVAEATLVELLTIYEQPEKIFTLPSGVLRESPALEQLKKELVTKQARLSLILSKNFERHPDVKDARMDVEIMTQQILDAIQGEIKSTQSNIEIQKSQLALLNAEIDKLNDQLVTLSTKRTEHLRLTSEVKQLTESVNETQSSLSEVQSLVRAARTTGLITPVDEVQVSAYPDGISKKLVVAGGCFGGLILGFGLVLLVAPPMPSDADPTPGSNREETPATVVAGSMVRSASAIESAATAMQHAAKAMQALPPSRDGNQELFEVLRTKEVSQPNPTRETATAKETRSEPAPKEEPARFTPRRQTKRESTERSKAELTPQVANPSTGRPQPQAAAQPKPDAQSKPAQQPTPVSKQTTASQPTAPTARVSVPEVDSPKQSPTPPSTRGKVQPVKLPSPAKPVTAAPQNVAPKQVPVPPTTASTAQPNAIQPQATAKPTKAPSPTEANFESMKQKLRELAQTEKTTKPVRPVDLAKSADAGASFVQTEPVQLSKPEPPTPEQTQVESSSEIRSASTSGNPFLKDFKTPQQGRKVATPPTSTAQQPSAPPARASQQTTRQPDKTVVEPPPVSLSGDAGQQQSPAFPTPEKIRQLSESISRFMKKKTDN